MYTDNRNAYRQIFFDVWQKHLKKLPLQTVEAQVLDVILAHPEYHAMLDNQQTFMTQEFSLQENPFIHMSLHIALREQLQLDRPAGIKEVAQNLIKKYSAHDAEHMMTTVMANMMYQSQQTGNAPDDNDYLRQLRAIV
jgi:hypothetical protein